MQILVSFLNQNRHWYQDIPFMYLDFGISLYIYQYDETKKKTNNEENANDWHWLHANEKQ